MIASLAGNAHAIGPKNVLIVVSDKSPEALALANYYAERRGVPRTHVARIPLRPLESIRWDVYQRSVVDVVEDHIRRHKLQDFISVWATTPGCPFIVENNSSSGVIYFGGPQAPSSNPSSPGAFMESNGYFDKMVGYDRPREAARGRYLAMRIDAGSIPDTTRLIDNSIAADGSFPDGTVYLLDGDGPRSSRKDSIPTAQKLLEVLGRKVVRRSSGKLEGASDVVGLYTGVIWMNVSANKYLPGALADHLTSFGGRMKLYRGQLAASDFLAAGCSASYGTVVEPYNYPAKFPTAQLHVYYALGFTAVESYWMSVAWPQQGLFIGDPLTRPYGAPPTIAVNDLAPEEVVSGVVDFEIAATAPKGQGVAGVDVLLDGEIVHQERFGRIPEAATFELTFGGRKASYTAPKGQTLGEAVVGLGGRAAAAGLQVTVRPGLIFVLQPAGSGEGGLSIQCSTPTVPVEVLGARQDDGKPTPGQVTWQISGRSAPGDSLALVLVENDRPIQTLQHEIAFDRPASGVCTSLRLDWQSKLPKGYRLETELAPNNPEVGLLRVLADPDKLARLPAASLSVSKKGASTLEVPDNGLRRGLAGQGLEGLDIGCIRIGAGPPTLRTRAKFDTTRYADGRHLIEIVATLGSPTEASSLAVIPIVVRNSTDRLAVLPIQTNLRAGSPEKVDVARVTLEPARLRNVRFYVDGNEAPSQDVRNGVLRIDPNRWGAGVHGIAARLRDGDRDVLFSDNEVSVTIAPGPSDLDSP
jgi:uncharacterized protein (TIGR03790 family)